MVWRGALLCNDKAADTTGELIHIKLFERAVMSVN
jgi:hypothetical protein